MKGFARGLVLKQSEARGNAEMAFSFRVFTLVDWEGGARGISCPNRGSHNCAPFDFKLEGIQMVVLLLMAVGEKEDYNDF